MSEVEDFLSSKEEQEIVKAIRVAEKNTSGEIRVHIESNPQKDLMSRAKEVFCLLKMEKTEQRNGVLIYVAVSSKQFAILGDEGIHTKVTDDFWNAEKQLAFFYFSKEKYKQGLVEVIKKVGEKLKEYFPYQKEDVNELSDEISKN